MREKFKSYKMEWMHVGGDGFGDGIEIRSTMEGLTNAREGRKTD